MLTKDFRGLTQYLHAYLKEVPKTKSQHLAFIRFSGHYSGIIIIYRAIYRLRHHRALQIKQRRK
jgi:hypothetical protein